MHWAAAIHYAVQEQTVPRAGKRDRGSAAKRVQYARKKKKTRSAGVIEARQAVLITAVDSVFEGSWRNPPSHSGPDSSDMVPISPILSSPTLCRIRVADSGRCRALLTFATQI